MEMREMTLREYVEVLPKHHLARRQYDALVTAGHAAVLDLSGDETPEHAKSSLSILSKALGEADTKVTSPD